MCPSNATYMTGIPVTSCTDIRQLCQYIYLTWTYCNQQCVHEYWYAYILHYWYMPLNKDAWHMSHTCPTVFLMYSTHIDHTLLPTVIKNQWTATFIYHTNCKTCASNKFPQKCHILCQLPNLHDVLEWGTYANYMPHMNSLALTIWPGPLFTDDNNDNDARWLFPQPNYTYWIGSLLKLVKNQWWCRLILQINTSMTCKMESQ